MEGQGFFYAFIVLGHYASVGLKTNSVLNHVQGKEKAHHEIQSAARS